MLRIILYVVLIAVLSFGVSWLFENNAIISFEWQNTRVETNLAAIALYAVVAIILTAFITRLTSWARAVPENIAEDIASRRRIKGYNYLVNGFVALVENNLKKSESLAVQAIKMLGEEPAALLLSGEIEKRKGNLDESNKYLSGIIKSKDLEDIAQHKIVSNLEEAGKYQKAIDFASKTNGKWVEDSLLSLYKKNHNWLEALELIDKKIGFFTAASDKQKLKREQAIIYMVMAKDYYAKARVKEAYRYSEKAYFILPDFIPAIVLYADSSIALGKNNKAENIIERAWLKNPDEKLAEVFSRAISSLKMNKQLKKFSELYNLNPDNILSKTSFARFLFNNGFSDQAREILETGVENANNANSFKLLAKLEEALGGGRERINSLVKRAEFAEQEDVWGCFECGKTSEEWHGICPECKSFDSYKTQKANIKILSSAEKISNPEKVDIAEFRRPAR